MAEQRVRIIDIAKELGVSTATVSNVIHGKTERISESTVQRVREALERRQYVPSMAGILLARSSSRIVGVMVNDHERYGGHPLEDGLMASAVSCLSAALREAGYFLMVQVTRDRDEIVQMASMWNMEGVIVMGYCREEYEDLKSRLKVPLVVFDGASSGLGEVCGLMPDGCEGGRQMGAHFREMSYTRALCVTDCQVDAEDLRLKGFREGLGGSTVDVLCVPAQRQERRRFYESRMDQLCSYRGIFAVNDLYAVEIMAFLQEKGLRIPEDTAIAGFGDSPLCEQVYPPLTTVSQGRAEQARRAVEELKRLRGGEGALEEAVQPVTLQTRRSTMGRRPQMQRRGRLYP